MSARAMTKVAAVKNEAGGGNSSTRLKEAASSGAPAEGGGSAAAPQSRTERVFQCEARRDEILAACPPLHHTGGGKDG